MTEHIHLVIVTGQAQANLIPILQFKPDKVALAVSDSMQQAANLFEKTLKKAGGYSEQALWRYNHVPDANLEAIKSKAYEIEKDLTEKYPDSRITYHATGGNKLMTLGFYEVFNIHNILYCDSQHNRIEYLAPENQQPVAIEPVLSIENALYSMGQLYRQPPASQENWQAQAQQRKPLSKWLAQQADGLSGFFGVINALADQAISETARGVPERVQHPRQHLSSPPRGIWKEALKKLAEFKVLQWDEQQSDCLYFDSIEGARYVHGQWLEEYVWHVAKDQRPEEVKANVEFSELDSAKKDIRNEMDCIVIHQNRLLFMECKTGNMTKNRNKNTEILYKLESLGHRAGGIFGARWLILARQPDLATQTRAKTYGIQIIYGTELKKLDERIKKWMNYTQ